MYGGGEVHAGTQGAAERPPGSWPALRQPARRPGGGLVRPADQPDQRARRPAPRCGPGGVAPVPGRHVHGRTTAGADTGRPAQTRPAARRGPGPEPPGRGPAGRTGTRFGRHPGPSPPAPGPDRTTAHGRSAGLPRTGRLARPARRPAPGPGPPRPPADRTGGDLRRPYGPGAQAACRRRRSAAGGGPRRTVPGPALDPPGRRRGHLGPGGPGPAGPGPGRRLPRRGGPDGARHPHPRTGHGRGAPRVGSDHPQTTGRGSPVHPGPRRPHLASSAEARPAFEDRESGRSPGKH